MIISPAHLQENLGKAGEPEDSAIDHAIDHVEAGVMVILFEKDKIDKSSSPSRDSKIKCWIWLGRASVSKRKMPISESASQPNKPEILYIQVEPQLSE